MKRFINTCLFYACTSGMFLIQSCSNNPAAIPFPEHETEFSQPVSMAYKLSEPKKIKWESANPDRIKPATETKIDFNKLPSKPFDDGSFRPLKKPMIETKFDLNSLPDTAFDLDKLPSQKITFKVSILGQPIRTKATKPRIREKATQSIFEYGLEQGFSTGGQVSNIFQDSRSFLWICTSNGLYRYDGENFDLYTADQGLTSFNFINRLSEDRKGQIWAFSSRNVDIIDLNDGILKHMVTSQEPITDDISSALIDSLGKIWFSTNKGIYIIDPENETLKHLSIAQGLYQNDIHSLLEDGLGNIWIGSQGGIDIVNTDKRTLKHMRNSGRFSNRFTKYDKDRLLVRASDGSVNIVDLKKGTWKQLGTAQGISSDTIYSLCADNNGDIWVATIAGVDIVDTDKGEIKHLTAAQGLSSDVMSTLLKDNQGHIWVSDGYAEVDIIDQNGGMFKKLSTQQGLSGNNSGGLFEDDQGRIWIDGGDVLDMKTVTVKHVDSSHGLKLIPHRFLEDEKGQIWIIGGVYDKVGAYIFNQNAGTLKHLSVSTGMNGDNVFGIYKDKADNIWLNCDSGISVYNPRDKTFKNLNKSGGLSDDFVWSCMEDDEGNMWVLTIGHGLDIIDAKRETIRHFITGKGENFNPIEQVLVKDEKGKILMSSLGYGIYIIDPTNKTFINFTTKEGLISNQVTSLMEKKGIIYAGTNEGLTVITSGNESRQSPEWRVKSYGKPQLIDHVDFNSNSVFFTSKDQIWWGVGADGILIMDEPKKDTSIPPTYITGVDIMEQSQIFSNKQLFQKTLGTADTIWSTNRDIFYIKGRSPADTGYSKTNHITWDSVTGPWNLPVNLILPYYQNFIRFHFTATHLGNPEKTRYRYILEGIDKTWSNISDKAITDDYRNLSPGNYTFKVSSRGFNGLWSKPAELNFTITPPWWQTWWFRTFMAIVFIFILYGIYRWRTATLRKQKRVLEQTVKERTAEVVEEKIEIEKQKAKSDELLLNILPSEVAEELKEKGYTTAKSFDEVTILFSDIKGFTHVAERMTAQELVKEIDTYFSAFDHIMEEFGLEKIKTIGDAYIAAGGLPEENKASADKVVEAAIAMQNAVDLFKKERTEKGLPHFELRIGIHTGPVVAGVVGIKKFQYDIWGDTVNMAARMEQSGVPGKINISQYTYEKVKDQFTCTHRGKIEAKNKGEIDMYFVEK